MAAKAIILLSAPVIMGSIVQFSIDGFAALKGLEFSTVNLPPKLVPL
jgi:hypothetical protein